MAFRSVSKLDDFIKIYIEDVLKNENREMMIKDVMKEVGEFADVSWTTIKAIKDNTMQPSLPVAIKIVEFFKTTIEQMFYVEEFENPHEVNVANKNKKEQKVCKHTECEKKAIARGFCNTHYHEFRNHNPHLFNNIKPETCQEENCNSPHHAKGFCSFHYNKFYRESRLKNG